MLNPEAMAKSITDDTEMRMTVSRLRMGNAPSYDALDHIRPDEPLRRKLAQRLSTEGTGLIPRLPEIDVDSTAEIFYHDATLNKIHSIALDYLDSLPFRPDLAFDAAWRAFESLLHHYAATAWPAGGPHRTTLDLMTRFASEVCSPLLQREIRISDAFNTLMEMVPDSIGRYGLARMLYERGVYVTSQFALVRNRVEELIGNELYDFFSNTYMPDGHITAENHYRGARKVKRMMLGEPLKFDGKDVAGLDEARRIEFIGSAILYTSRCERAHGDYFSPFISDKASMKTYDHWYWLLSVTLAMHSILLMKYGEYRKAEIVTPISVATSISFNSTFFVATDK